MDNLELVARIEDLLISGLVTTHRTCTYARIIAGDMEGDNAPRGKLYTLEQLVINFFNSKDIPVDSKNVADCYVKPQSRVNKSNKPIIGIQFASRKHK